MSEINEPEIGTTVRLGEPHLQAGWCYHHVEEGWVRVWRSGGLDRGHTIPWKYIAETDPVVVETSDLTQVYEVAEEIEEDR